MRITPGSLFLFFGGVCDPVGGSKKGCLGEKGFPSMKASMLGLHPEMGNTKKILLRGPVVASLDMIMVAKRATRCLPLAVSFEHLPNTTFTALELCVCFAGALACLRLT